MPFLAPALWAGGIRMSTYWDSNSLQSGRKSWAVCSNTSVQSQFFMRQKGSFYMRVFTTSASRQDSVFPIFVTGAFRKRPLTLHRAAPTRLNAAVVSSRFRRPFCREYKGGLVVLSRLGL